MALVLELVMGSKQAVVITNEPYASLLETTVKWLQFVADPGKEVLSPNALELMLTLAVTRLLSLELQSCECLMDGSLQTVLDTKTPLASSSTSNVG